MSDRRTRLSRVIGAVGFVVLLATMALLLLLPPSRATVVPLLKQYGNDSQMHQGQLRYVTAPEMHQDRASYPSINPSPSAAGAWPAAEDPGIRHTRLKLILGLIGEVWGWIVLAAIAFGGLSPWLRDLARRLGLGRLGTLSPYVILLSALLAVLNAPIAFYSDYIIEHEFGLSNQDFWGWLGDSMKGLGVGIVISLIVLNLVYWLVRRSPRRWWLYGATAVVVFSVVLGTLAPILITPLFNKFEPLQGQELKGRILMLAEQGGVQVADVLQVDMSRQTNAANAYFIGIGPTKRIVLGDTLLAKFSDDEVLTVVAHEMGHQVHNDIWRGIFVGALFFFIAFYVLYRVLDPSIQRFKGRLRFSRLEDAASLPLVLLLVGLLFFLAQPVQNTYSRYIEHQADRFALDLTHQNEVYANALEKLGRVNVSDPDPPAWMEFVFYSHPSLKNRIEFAQTYRPWSQ